MNVSSIQAKKLCFTGKYQADFITDTLPTSLDEQDILLETIISGISAGTEGMWYNGSASALKSGRKNYPYFPGYELVGRVVAKGKAVTDYVLGDLVFAMKPHATHALLKPSDIYFKLSSDIILEDALAIALTGTALHAVHRSSITAGDPVAVIGLGTLGFILVQLLSRVLSCPIRVITRSESKRQLAYKLAESLEANDLIFSAFDTTGMNAGIQVAAEVVQSQGEIIAVGFYNSPVALDGELLFTKELSLKGVRGTGSNIVSPEFNRWDKEKTMQFASQLVFSKKISITPIITHRFKAVDIHKAYDIIETKSADYIQIVIDWSA